MFSCCNPCSSLAQRAATGSDLWPCSVAPRRFSRTRDVEPPGFSRCQKIRSGHFKGHQPANPLLKGKSGLSGCLFFHMPQKWTREDSSSGVLAMGLVMKGLWTLVLRSGFAYGIWITKATKNCGFPLGRRRKSPKPLSFSLHRI